MGAEAFSLEETAASGSLASVTVMQPAQPRQCDNVALVGRFDGTCERTILAEGSVGPILVMRPRRAEEAKSVPDFFWNFKPPPNGIFTPPLTALRHPRLRSVYGPRACCHLWGSHARQNLPHRSRENEFTDGRVNEFRRVKDTDVL